MFFIANFLYSFSMNRTKMLQFLDGFRNAALKRIRFSDLYAPDLIVDNIYGRIIGRQNYQHMADLAFEAFPDWHVETKKIEILGNTAIVSYEYAGTYQKRFDASSQSCLKDSSHIKRLDTIPIGGKIANLHSECVYIFDKKSIVRMHMHSDYESFYRQLGQEKANVELTEQLQNRFFLSKREIQCVSLTLLGFSAKYTASLFFISPRTVETHLQKAYEKLKCNGKKQCFEIMLTNQSLHLWHEYANAILKKTCQ